MGDFNPGGVVISLGGVKGEAGGKRLHLYMVGGWLDLGGGGWSALRHLAFNLGGQ